MPGEKKALEQLRKDLEELLAQKRQYAQSRDGVKFQQELSNQRYAVEAAVAACKKADNVLEATNKELREAMATEGAKGEEASESLDDNVLAEWRALQQKTKVLERAYTAARQGWTEALKNYLAEKGKLEKLELLDDEDREKFEAFDKQIRAIRDEIKKAQAAVPKDNPALASKLKKFLG